MGSNPARDIIFSCSLFFLFFWSFDSTSFLVLHLDLHYDCRKLSFHTQELDAPDPYKLLLAHLGGQESKGSAGLSPNIADMRILFQIITCSNCILMLSTFPRTVPSSV